VTPRKVIELNFPSPSFKADYIAIAGRSGNAFS